METIKKIEKILDDYRTIKITTLAPDYSTVNELELTMEISKYDKEYYHTLYRTYITCDGNLLGRLELIRDGEDIKLKLT